MHLTDSEGQQVVMLDVNWSWNVSANLQPCDPPCINIILGCLLHLCIISILLNPQHLYMLCVIVSRELDHSVSAACMGEWKWLLLEGTYKGDYASQGDTRESLRQKNPLRCSSWTSSSAAGLYLIGVSNQGCQGCSENSFQHKSKTQHDKAMMEKTNPIPAKPGIAFWRETLQLLPLWFCSVSAVVTAQLTCRQAGGCLGFKQMHRAARWSKMGEGQQLSCLSFLQTK